MKKLCVLLALAMALALTLGSAAFAAEGDLLLCRDEENKVYFNSAFSDGETLYLSDSLKLYAWRVGDAALTEYEFDFGEQAPTVNVTPVPFLCDGQLYAVTLTSSYDGHSEFVGAALNAVALEDGVARLEKRMDVDWDGLLEYYDEDVYPIRPQSIVGIDEKAYMQHNNSRYENVVSVLDLQTGRIEEVDALRDAYALRPYRDGALLVEQYSYDRHDTARLIAYDPKDDSAQTLAELPVEGYNPPGGLAYDAATDTIYCLNAGEICPVDLQAGAIGEGVTEMPLEPFGSTGAVVLHGGYYAFAAEGLAIRNLAPAQRPGVRLKVVDSNYSNVVTEAYTRFTAGRDDVSVVLSRDFNGTARVVENMMNRDDSVDIYTLTTDTPVFDALYRRGFLMELDGCEAIDALAQAMYPSLRECLSSDGHLVALPVEVYGFCMGYNEKALEVLGLKLADMPDNWWDFLDFLPTLQGPLAEHPEVSLNYRGMTASQMRNNLFYTIFSDYQSYVNTVDPTLGYDTDLLRGLLEKLWSIDFTALGFAEDEEEDSVSVTFDSSDLVLFETYVSCTCGENFSDSTPVMMGLDAQTRAPMTLNTTVAIVNPFTSHPDEALAFMDQLARALSNPVRYSLCPDLNEPIRGAVYEKYAEEARENLEQLRAQLESAEPAQVQQLEELIKDAESNVEFWQDHGWEISLDSIEWYRAHAGDVVVVPVNWLYADESGEAWDLMNRFSEGGISLDEMLKGIDRKVQMMQLEGN